VASSSPEERRLIARMGGFARAAKYGPEVTKPARKAFIERFVDEVDPDRVLPEDERNRRARAALQVHMTRLNLASVKARRKAADDRRGAG
jgi:hypothetical protein